MNKRKLLTFLLAVNSFGLYAANDNISSGKYEKLYDSMVKNLEQGKSNEENYSVLDKTLEKRNKELKDLYNQSDYIVKPEYLEWQVFFSANYSHKRSGDNTLSNGKYHSDPAKVNGKFYLGSTEPKQVDLGLYIPERTIKRSPVELKLVNPPEITLSSLDVNPDVNPNVNPTVNSGAYTEYIPTGSMKSFLDAYENTFSAERYGIRRDGGTQLLIGDVDDGSSYFINYSVNSGIDINNDVVIDSFSRNGFNNGDSYWNLIVGPDYTSATGTPAFYAGGTRVVNVFGGTNEDITVQSGKTLDLKGPFSYGMVAEGGDNNISNNGTITDTKENDKTNTWYNDNIPHIEESITYRVEDGDPLTPVVNIVKTEHPDGNKLTIGGREVYRHGGSLDSVDVGPSGTTGVGDTYTSTIQSYLGGYTGYKVGMFISNNSGDQAMGPSGTTLTNTGNIEFNGYSSIGMYTNAGTELNDIQMVNDKDATITLHGGRYANPTALGDYASSKFYSNFGMKLDGTVINGSPITEKIILNNGIIDVTDGAGIAVVNGSVGAGEVLTDKTELFSSGDILPSGTVLSSAIILPIGSIKDAFVENGKTGLITITNGTGIYLAPSSGSARVEDAVNNGSITVNSGVGVYSVGGRDYTTRITNNGEISVSGGNSIALVAESKNAEAVNNSSNLTLGDWTGGFYATKGGKVINTADLTTSSNNVTLFSIDSGSTGESRGNITMAGDNSVAFYNKGTLSSTGDITISGKNSVAVYNTGATATSTINTEKISHTGDGGAVFFTDGGTINIKPQKSTTRVDVSGESSYLFYDTSFAGSTLPQQTFVINGNFEATVGTKAIAFDYKNATGGLLNYVENNLLNVTSGTTTINIEGTAFHAKNSTISIKEVSGIQTAKGGLGTGSVKLIGSDIFFAENSIINIDQNSNLDLLSTTDTYGKNQSNIANSTVNLNSGYSITGTKNNQYAIGQENYLGTSISLNNNGDINLKGSNTTGIYGNYAKINNNGTIKVGDNGAGIFSSNSSTAINTGDIDFGNGSIGIYGVNNYGTRVASTYDQINITMNSGTITATGATEGYGIYANNTKGSGYSTVKFNSGLIDMSGISATDRDKAVAVTVRDTTLNSSGDINTAENGIAFYIEKGVTSITNGTINLDKDNSIGLALQDVQGSNFTGTGATFNIDGDGIILFHLKNSTGITDNFTTNIVSGSNYRYADMQDSSFIFNKSISIEDNINFIVAQNSAVLLDSSSDINSTGTGNIGVYAKNAATSLVLSSISVANEVTNKGKINLGDSSTGIYADSNVRVLNDSGAIIAVGDNSQGIYAKNSGSILNKGNISIGDTSIGLYLNKAVSAENAGTINSTSDNAVGVYMNNQATFVNSGLIDLSGIDSIGIYDTGTGSRVITNNGEIKVGDALSIETPSVGIYSVDSGLTINQSAGGIISSGMNSMGIYSKNTVMNIDGTMNVGASGTGIYADSNSHVTLFSNAKLNIGALDAAGVYALGNSIVDNYTSDINYPADSYAFVLNSGATLNNHAGTITLDNGKVFAYSDNANINNYGDILVTGTDNIALYGVKNSNIVNTGTIDTSGTVGSNVGIYGKNSNIYNDGTIINNATILGGDSIINDEYNPFANEYSVAIYGENSNITTGTNSRISVGENSVGLYGVVGNIINKGTITSVKDGAIGMFIDRGTAENAGLIDLYGANSVGLAGKTNSTLINSGTIKIHGDNSIGIFANLKSTVNNTGTIEVLGNNSTGIHLQGSSTLINKGTIILGSGVTNSVEVSRATGYDIPEIQNAGIIKVNERFEVPKDFQISIKPMSSSFRNPTVSEILGESYALEDINGRYLISNAVSFVAPYFAATEPIVVLPDFSQGTNAIAYKLEDTFVTTTPNGGPNSGKVKVKSKSLTWDAIPNVNINGNVDIWMVKVPYDTFTYGLWYEDFGRALDDKYAVATPEGTIIFDKLDLIDNEKDLRHYMASLAGNVYANINQREEETADIFSNSLDLLQNSKNNTKENVKVNIITAGGSTKEDTDGVIGYDYTAVGVLGLREVERTYKHTFGYSLGYLHSSYEFDDNNESEEWVDTIQIGAHNKYTTDGWQLKNDLTGRVSLHNVDRNIDWPAGRSEMNGTYETYSITSDNTFGKELKIGKNSSITPYGGLKAMYVTRPTFEENGLERLEVEGNDAWSVKPRAGVELKAEMPLGPKTAWKAKATLDLAYEYELADLNEREKARLVAIEDGYHNLAKPEDQKGQFRSKASIGAEVEDRYGVFLTGEYVTGEGNHEEYRAGVVLKAVF